MRDVIEALALRKEHGSGTTRVVAVREATLSLAEGEMVSIVGPSGAGKSTLLHLLGALDRPTSGEVRIDGESLSDLSEDGLAAIRREKLGFVFQFFNLQPTLSAWENVAVPLMIRGRRLKRCRDVAVELLDRVGLAERAEHRPFELSGGEMQRVALARALVGEPVAVLADEPTGNLDTGTGEDVLKLLRRIADDGVSVLMVTHDAQATSIADRAIHLVDGEIRHAGKPQEVLAAITGPGATDPRATSSGATGPGASRARKQSQGRGRKRSRARK